MTRRRALVVLVAALATLATVLVAWVAWPRPEPRADLVAVAPITTTASVPAAGPTPTPRPMTSPTVPTTAPTPPGLVPDRLRVEAVGIDVAVVEVGLAPDGAMEIPGVAEVGWYRLGPRPGETGSAVLAGHIDLVGQRGAFAALATVPVGAEVVVAGEGREARFVVTGREQVPKAEIDLARYFTRDGPPRLTLITCGGAFDRGARHYADNIVVTAEPRR